MSIFTGELLLRNILPSFEETPLPSLDMSRSWDGIFDMAGSSRRNLRFGGRWSSVTARHGGFRDASVIVMPLERAGLFSATVPPHRGRLLITFWANEAVDRARSQIAVAIVCIAMATAIFGRFDASRAD